MARYGAICRISSANGTRRERGVAGSEEGLHCDPRPFPGRRGKKGGPDPGFGRSRGGFTGRIHLRCDGLGRPIDFLVTGGQASDSRPLQPLMALAAAIRRPDFLLGDKGYDSDDNRASLLIQGIRPVIPSMRSRKVEIPHDETLHRQRNRIERMIDELKQSRRVATRYDESMSSFRGFITLAAVKLWLPSFVHTAARGSRCSCATRSMASSVTSPQSASSGSMTTAWTCIPTPIIVSEDVSAKEKPDAVRGFRPRPRTMASRTRSRDPDAAVAAVKAREPLINAGHRARALRRDACGPR